ncbi:MAG: hypothetical protein B7Z26_09275 [Asticcacaulis sp. 32-58-5]|nr:MAG: hypothetical protein B7Z26_09275 [Asticcacaulis sp. 32-58-5]
MKITVIGTGYVGLVTGTCLAEVGNRFNSSERNVFRTAFGLRGNLGSVSEGFLRNLSYDTYYSYARTQNTDSQRGSASRSRFAQALLSVGGAAPVLNVFGPNISEAGAAAIAINSTNVQVAEQQVLAANIAGEAFDLPAGPVDFNAGFEWRYNYAKYTPDTFLSSGDVSGFNAAKPTAGSTTVREIFGEVRAPILADAPFAKRLNVNGAFRYSDYDLEGVGGVWTYSIGAEWQPKGQPEKVRVYDFVLPELGKASPYGVYDRTRNEGWVNVGTDHDTAEFAVAIKAIHLGGAVGAHGAHHRAGLEALPLVQRALASAVHFRIARAAIAFVAFRAAVLQQGADGLQMVDGKRLRRGRHDFFW